MAIVWVKQLQTSWGVLCKISQIFETYYLMFSYKWTSLYESLRPTFQSPWSVWHQIWICRKRLDILLKNIVSKISNHKYFFFEKKELVKRWKPRNLRHFLYASHLLKKSSDFVNHSIAEREIIMIKNDCNQIYTGRNYSRRKGNKPAGEFHGAEALTIATGLAQIRAAASKWHIYEGKI